MVTKHWAKRWFILIIMLMMALTLNGAANAQTYEFAVPEMLMQNYIQPDGSLRIVYDITFENYGSPIDVVDIGTPNEDYDVGQFTATLDGKPLTDIRPSTYIDVGVEIDLDDYEIMPGESDTLHVEFVAPGMVYADTTNEENASLQITPTWFDSSVVSGPGDIEIRVTLPPSIQPDEVLYQDVSFTEKYTDDQGRVVVTWRYENVRATEAYRVGVSFPRRAVDNVIEITFWDLLGRWLGNVLPIVFGCIPFFIPIIFIFGIIRAIVRAAKPNYLPPIAEVEGGGIKRGLTAPEAAVVLEIPLTKVLGLVIFGMLEKGLVRQTETEPLTLEVTEDFQVKGRAGLDDKKSRQQARRRAAQQNGTVIHSYEYPFLDLIEAQPDTPINKLAVVKPMETLVDGVAAKMKGFDLSDTQDYYQRIVDRAMEQAQALGEIEQREAYLDRYLPWVMMRRDYRPALNMGGYHYWPTWARTHGGVSVGGQSAASGKSGRASTTTFGDVSASFAGWAETTMGGMAAAILPTRLSKPSPVSSSSSSGGSSCACACAGCACACACAGGGR
jgi:hypothetical protein